MKENESKKTLKISKGIPVINPYAGGIDIGDTEHYVAISYGNGGHTVKCYKAFTGDLK